MNDKITITDAKTGETIERQMTDEEQIFHNQLISEAKLEEQNRITKKEMTESKLMALGLTIDDLKFLGLGGN